MQNKNLILVIIGGLILLGLGYSFGLSLGQKAIEETETPLADLLESKVIRGLNTTALGEVIEIAGRNLTLNSDGDTLTISIKENATIYRLVPPEEVTETPQPVEREEIEFEEIKVGDQVDIPCELKADGTLEGIDVTVLP
jgi:hypothetical protein